MARPAQRHAAKTAAAKPKAVSVGARRIISQVLEEGVTAARVKGVLDAAFEDEVLVDAVCSECGGAMKVKRPDVKRQVETLVAFIEQAEGRPEQARVEASVVIIERPPL